MKRTLFKSIKSEENPQLIYGEGTEVELLECKLSEESKTGVYIKLKFPTGEIVQVHNCDMFIQENQW